MPGWLDHWNAGGPDRLGIERAIPAEHLGELLRRRADRRARDMLTVDDLFIKDGYVLDFSNPRYAIFFREEVGVDIDDPKWSVEGTSKGKRLRYFLRTVEPPLAVKALKALWEHRQVQLERSSAEETVANAKQRFDELLVRLGDRPEPVKASPSDKPAKRPNYDRIHEALMSLTNRPPQERGFAFEKFLQKTFDAFGLEAEKPFRLTGEQIDGSFHLDGATYLLEAKWQNDRTGAGDLHAFHGKVDTRAAWARGLFVSYSGFTEEGLIAFGRARKVICMDGFDLSEMLRRKLALPDVLHRKVRKAVEYGVVLARVSDLFP
jgi:hypothetical protein